MKEIDKAVELLKKGDIVAIPTETVYGLAASIHSESGLKKIFEIKERPFFDPLIVHVLDVAMAKSLAGRWSKTCDILAAAFWPGPLTLVVKKSGEVSDIITAGLDSVGLRCPNHPVALEVIKKLNAPLAAPSANKFKRTSPTKKEHVLAEFNGEVMTLEGGQSEVGIESTVAGVFEDRIEIYRPGMITKERIENALKKNGAAIPVKMVQSPVAPGQLKHHYMPNIPIVLSWDNATPNMEELGLGEKIGEEWTLEESPELVARKLYGFFREAERSNKEFILIVLNSHLKSQSDWSGILNRLEKAKSFEIF
ncbi:MAG: L-threonylcarbamoyladenylate synthase [Bacteriovoracaceae bacterium]